MTDPLSLVALGAAVGGATGRFVEKAYDSGQKWIAAYFASHNPKAIEKAQENSADFLNQLADRIKILEEQKAASQEQIETAQDHPGFSVTLQKALLTAAQTDSHQKHMLLARILADRLAAPPEGLRAMASKMACDSIGYMTPNQLKLLGLNAELVHIRPPQQFSTRDYSIWIESRFSKYLDVHFTTLDLLHLESLSCLKYIPGFVRDLNQILTQKNNGDCDPKLFESPRVLHVKGLWDQGLNAVDLTSVGQVIGVYVSDLLTGTNTAFKGWD